MNWKQVEGHPDGLYKTESFYRKEGGTGTLLGKEKKGSF